MSSKSKKQMQEKGDIALQNFKIGYDIVCQHPIFSPIIRRASVFREERSPYPSNGIASVSNYGAIYCHPKKRISSDVWVHVLAHCSLHLAMEHFFKKEYSNHWNTACDLVVEKFLNDLKFGSSHNDVPLPQGISADEDKLYEYLINNNINSEYTGFGTAGINNNDMIFYKVEDSHNYNKKVYDYGIYSDWSSVFAIGLGNAVQSAVNVAAGYQDTILEDMDITIKSNAYVAKEWFVSSYPLLGAIASSFKLIEEPLTCQRMQIKVAAISCYLQEIYVNPAANLTIEESKFVLAHEFLHAALRHDARHEWRDAYLWNVACDYVINGWLKEVKCRRGFFTTNSLKDLTLKQFMTVSLRIYVHSEKLQLLGELVLEIFYLMTVTGSNTKMGWI